MRKVKTIYWIVTILFSAFMVFSAIPDALSKPEALSLVGNLGYPAYFVPFIGVAKLLGVIAILIPGFPRIKEWAYAGLFFDLFGATYSLIAVNGFQPGMLFMVIIIGFLFGSYFLFHKLQRGLQTV